MEDNGRTLVFDRVRSSYVVLTPEEWVRRHLVEFLITHCNAPLRSIVEEYPIPLNTMSQRADVVVMDGEAKPLLLVECKAAEIPLTRAVYEQAVRYNAVVGARYVMITNGLKTLLYECRATGYALLDSMPSLR